MARHRAHISSHTPLWANCWWASRRWNWLVFCAEDLHSGLESERSRWKRRCGNCAWVCRSNRRRGSLRRGRLRQSKKFSAESSKQRFHWHNSNKHLRWEGRLNETRSGFLKHPDVTSVNIEWKVSASDKHSLALLEEQFTNRGTFIDAIDLLTQYVVLPLSTRNAFGRVTTSPAIN